MLLAIDVGNTNIKVGLFNGKALRASWRLSTARNKTSDEYGIVFMDLFSHENIRSSDISGVILSSVVPSVNYTIEHMLESYIDKQPLIVGPGIKTGLNIKIDNPKELGADLIADAVAAYKKYGGPCIAIDFGTATTMSVITEQAEFLGGCIMPGVKVAVDALTEKTSKLPKIELTVPGSFICKNTVSCMQAGLLYGYIGQIEYLIDNIKKEMNRPDAVVVATGGMSRIIGKHAKCIDKIDSLLTLEGLRMIYEMNQ